jgi:hypothetical protein
MYEAKWIPLDCLTSHKSSKQLDSVYYYPLSEPRPLRIWLYTEAKNPVVLFNEAITLSIESECECSSKERWLDMGLCDLYDPGRHAAFGLFALRGMNAGQTENSVLLIQPDLQWRPSGSLMETQRTLWGIARSDAGKTYLSPETVSAGTPVTFKLTYATGSVALLAGSRIRFFIPTLMDFPQTEKSSREGYFFGTVASSRSAGFDIEDISISTESHEKNVVTCVLPDGLIPGETLSISFRTSKNYLCPLVLQESEHLFWYSTLPPLRAEISYGGDFPFIGLSAENSHRFRITPGQQECLHLFLPGRLKQKDSANREKPGIALRGVFTDRFRNPSPQNPNFPEFTLMLQRNDEKATELPKESMIYSEERTRFEQIMPWMHSGVYRVEAVCKRTGKLLAASNPLEITSGSAGIPDIYWGEIHAHTEYSDGTGELTALYEHARTTGCMDFAACSDHACYFSDNQWEHIQDIANNENRLGEFITLVGYEWGGYHFHRNFYTSRDRMQLFRGIYQPDVKEVLRYFSGDEQVVGGPHGLISHGLIWEDHDPATERFVEIYSMWGAGDGTDRNFYPTTVNLRSAMTVSDLLKRGAVLGFTGGGDCHNGICGFASEDPSGQGISTHTIYEGLKFRCGMTAALMSFPDRIELVGALRNRKTYATTGDRILLSFSVSGLEMGECKVGENVLVKCAVHGCDKIKEICIIKDGNPEVVFLYNHRDVELEWEDPNFNFGIHSYYVKVVQNNGQIAWSSPVWIQKEKERQEDE